MPDDTVMTTGPTRALDMTLSVGPFVGTVALSAPDALAPTIVIVEAVVDAEKTYHVAQVALLVRVPWALVVPTYVDVLSRLTLREVGW